MRLEFVDFNAAEVRKMDDVAPANIDAAIRITEARLEKDKLYLGFIYAATYAPNGSYLRLAGRAIASGPEIKAVHEEWTKTNMITGQNGEVLMNQLHYTVSLNTVLIAKVFNMAPPVILAPIRLAKQEAPVTKTVTTKTINKPSKK